MARHKPVYTQYHAISEGLADLLKINNQHKKKYTTQINFYWQINCISSRNSKQKIHYRSTTFSQQKN